MNNKPKKEKNMLKGFSTFLSIVLKCVLIIIALITGGIIDLFDMDFLD